MQEPCSHPARVQTKRYMTAVFVVVLIRRRFKVKCLHDWVDEDLQLKTIQYTGRKIIFKSRTVRRMAAWDSPVLKKRDANKCRKMWSLWTVEHVQSSKVTVSAFKFSAATFSKFSVIFETLNMFQIYCRKSPVSKVAPLCCI